MGVPYTLGFGIWDLGSDLIALDVALLPPPDIGETARALSASLGGGDGDGLVLDDTHLPHITLTQQFIRRDEAGAVFERIDEVLRSHPPLPLTVTGAARNGHSLWLSIARTPLLDELHERLMETLRGFERAGGTAAAFAGGDARVSDVLWVTSYRLKASFKDFTPHITVGALSHGSAHDAEPPRVDATAFVATTVAACHLGRFCSCRAVLREWTLT
jgi:2'-5' RNA ligase